MRNFRIALALFGTAASLLSAVAPAHATYEGRVGRIAFGAFEAGNTQSDIYSVRPDGQALRQLTDAAGLDICPAYSADGKQIAFCSNRTGVYEIWVMKANGKQERQVTSLGTRALFPDFSPDGTRLAFSATPPGGGNPELWTVPVEGGEPTRLTETAAWSEQDPVWSPDGTLVLYRRVAPDRSTSQLWLIDVSSGVQRQLTFDPTFKDQVPDWSPDGSRIAYGADGDVWVMNADGSGATNLTNSATYEFGAAWSPRGDWIAFTGEGDDVPAGERYLQVMRPDGTDRQVVAPTPGLRQAVPAWQPLGGGR
jgi:Tol biopolymer transport system component